MDWCPSKFLQTLCNFSGLWFLCLLYLNLKAQPYLSCLPGCRSLRKVSQKLQWRVTNMWNMRRNQKEWNVIVSLCWALSNIQIHWPHALILKIFSENFLKAAVTPILRLWSLSVCAWCIFNFKSLWRRLFCRIIVSFGLFRFAGNKKYSTKQIVRLIKTLKLVNFLTLCEDSTGYGFTVNSSSFLFLWTLYTVYFKLTIKSMN